MAQKPRSGVRAGATPTLVRALTVLLIDNHDSYTWNLAHLIAGICGRLPVVVANDAIDMAGVRALNPAAIVISPGPGRPGVPRDLGVCTQVLAEFEGPIFGICLGHQAIAWAHGARIEHAPEPRHGRLSAIQHDGQGIFAGLPTTIDVVRYHSLRVVEPLPPSLLVTARADDGVVMGLRHATRPHVGVQFHPESIGTEAGRSMMARFLESAGVPTLPLPAPPSRPPAAEPPRMRVLTRTLSQNTDTEAAFCALFAHRFGACWLDSAGRQGASPSRFSVMGAADGPLGQILTWNVGGAGARSRQHRADEALGGKLTDHLRQAMPATPLRHDLPFDFVGGWVGWLGYGCKALWGIGAPSPDDAPDAAMAFLDRLVIVDHDTDTTWLVALVERGGEDSARVWFNTTTSALAQLPPPPAIRPAVIEGLRPTIDRDQYLAQIGDAQCQILDGESYEVCLTQAMRGSTLASPLDAYRRLRRLNPAPYGSFLQLPGATVLSSSPEQFLGVDRHSRVTARPIKGTARRHTDPRQDEIARQELQASEKDRAENLMIVDLLRHDLGRVCSPATVTVPSLMAAEAFSTVHHLVSTITGELRPDRDAIDAIVAAFPPGSMTGAPKERTVEILDRIEPHGRGVYSGALGWFSVNGTADFSVVIRAAVVTPQGVRVGIGGAITALSDPAAEWAEAMLKGQALDQALTAERPKLPATPQASDQP